MHSHCSSASNCSILAKAELAQGRLIILKCCRGCTCLKDCGSIALQVLGFIVLLSGTSIYNELIRTWLPESFSRASSLDTTQVGSSCLHLSCCAFYRPRMRSLCLTNCAALIMQYAMAGFPQVDHSVRLAVGGLAGTLPEA